jgi:hypothetical protein
MPKTAVTVGPQDHGRRLLPDFEFNCGAVFKAAEE